ncbi:MAG: peptidylprolyl isomerase [Candidatus Pelagibacter sp. TMED165]|nr:MAG: peptidylprolyl isomerase [Candidatus Pelagibacter sp. TMED165]
MAKSENSSFVVLKVNNQLITNIDIQNEKNYLLAINQNLESLDDKKLYEIAKASIIREKIKKNELKKYFNIDIYTKYIDNILEDFYTKLNFENIESLENYLLSKNLQIDTVKNKLNIEALWNELIYKRYNKQVEIDKEKLRKKIKEQKYKKESELFFVSEIIFSANNKSEIENKYKEILESINEIGFKNTANIYSISNTAKFGGEVGWVNKSRMSDNISVKLENIKIGGITDLIKVPNGFLIIKVLDKKMETIEQNEEEDLKQLIIYERDRQLNEFSSIYFQKIKKSSLINEK